MKTSTLSVLIRITLFVVLSVGCAFVTAPIPLTNTPEPTAISPQTATEAPVDLEAPYDENAVAQQDITSALAKSEKDGKLILLDFGANWCPDCIVLTVLFEDPTVKPFLEENFRVVRIDIGYGDKNLDVAQQYGNPIAKGIPAVVVLAPNGEILATTQDGSLANARTATPQDILAYLQTWLALKP